MQEIVIFSLKSSFSVWDNQLSSIGFHIYRMRPLRSLFDTQDCLKLVSDDKVDDIFIDVSQLAKCNLFTPQQQTKILYNISELASHIARINDNDPIRKRMILFLPSKLNYDFATLINKVSTFGVRDFLSFNYHASEQEMLKQLHAEPRVANAMPFLDKAQKIISQHHLNDNHDDELDDDTDGTVQDILQTFEDQENGLTAEEQQYFKNVKNNLEQHEQPPTDDASPANPKPLATNLYKKITPPAQDDTQDTHAKQETANEPNTATVKPTNTTANPTSLTATDNATEVESQSELSPREKRKQERQKKRQAKQEAKQAKQEAKQAKKEAKKAKKEAQKAKKAQQAEAKKQAQKQIKTDAYDDADGKTEPKTLKRKQKHAEPKPKHHTHIGKWVGWIVAIVALIIIIPIGTKTVINAFKPSLNSLLQKQDYAQATRDYPNNLTTIDNYILENNNGNQAEEISTVYETAKNPNAYVKFDNAYFNQDFKQAIEYSKELPSLNIQRKVMLSASYLAVGNLTQAEKLAKEVNLKPLNQRIALYKQLEQTISQIKKALKDKNLPADKRSELESLLQKNEKDLNQLKNNEQ